MTGNAGRDSMKLSTRLAQKQAHAARVLRANALGVRRAPKAPKAIDDSVANGKDNKHLNGRHGSPRSGDSPKARTSRTPGLGLPRKGVLLVKTPRTIIGRLTTVLDWHRQIGKIYREMRKHQIDINDGTKLTYVANIGATTARFIEETLPKGVESPPNYDLLSAAELEQLEYLIAKASGHTVQQRIELGTVGATYDN